MWLSSREVCQELRISAAVLQGMRKRGRIRFIKLGLNYRYELPKPTEARTVPAIERVAFLTYNELAVILGISRIRVRVGVHEGQYHPITVGKRKYFTLKELRRILAEREDRAGQAKQHVSKVIIEWAQHYLSNDIAPVQVLDTLIKTATIHLEDPARSQAISRLWNLFDQVDDLMREIKRPVAAQPGAANTSR